MVSNSRKRKFFQLVKGLKLLIFDGFRVREERTLPGN
jgi:hypothetical protein